MPLNLKIEAYRQEKRSVAYKEVQDRLVKELKKKNQWLAVSSTHLVYPLDISLDNLKESLGIPADKYKDKNGNDRICLLYTSRCV